MSELDLLVLGAPGRLPLVLLYGVTLGPRQVSALGYTVRYAQSGGLLQALGHDTPQTKNWVLHTPGITLQFPAHEAGHYLHTPITLTRLEEPHEPLPDL
jgi:hypothetical protein